MDDNKRAMYVTDDRDLPIERQRALTISFGGNGDWYVQVTPINGMSVEAVRICTSGGASTAVPGLTGAIAEAFRCMKAAEDGVSRTSMMSESFSSLKAEVDAWRKRFPDIIFINEVAGFEERE